MDQSGMRDLSNQRAPVFARRGYLGDHHPTSVERTTLRAVDPLRLVSLRRLWDEIFGIVTSVLGIGSPR